MNGMTMEDVRRRVAPPAPDSSEVAASLATGASIGLFNAADFELTLRVASYLSSTTFVPNAYRKWIQRTHADGTPNGNPVLNAAGEANCVVALSIATRVGVDVFAVMLSMVPINGRPSWSAQFAQAVIDSDPRYTGVRWRVEDLGPKSVPYETKEWDEQVGRYVRTTKTIDIRDMRWTAWTTRVDDRSIVEASVTLETAVREGWYSRAGSKWPTMTDQMGKYRSAAFLSRLTVANRLLGLPTAEELEDALIVVPREDGGHDVHAGVAPRSTETVAPAPAPAPVAEPVAVAVAEPAPEPPPTTPPEPTDAFVAEAQGRIKATQRRVDLEAVVDTLANLKGTEAHRTLMSLARSHAAHLNSAPPVLAPPEKPVTFSRPAAPAAAPAPIAPRTRATPRQALK